MAELTAQRIEAERAKFEALYRSRLGFIPSMLYRRDFPDSVRHGEYIREWTQGQWEGWLDRACAIEAEVADQGEAVAWIPKDALKQLAPPLLILRNVTLITYAGEDHAPLYTRPAAPEGTCNAARVYELLDKAAHEIIDKQAGDNVREWLFRAWYHKVVPGLAAAPSPKGTL